MSLNHPPIDQMYKDLFAESDIDLPYLALILSSCSIATFGLLSNSAAVIIGAMVIAPLMLPIRAIAFAALEGNPRLLRHGLMALGLGSTMGICLSTLVGWVAGIEQFGSEIMARTQPTLLDLGIAVTAGAIGGYAKIESKISSTLAGTAIAVALMPPLCVIGLGLSQGLWFVSRGAMLLYLTNLLGIALACMVIFSWAGYAPFIQAQRPLLAAGILTVLLILPLGIRFGQLVEHARLQNRLRRALLNKTLTFQQLELTNLQTTWSSTPPTVRLHVNAKEAVTPRQVELLEEFVRREMEHSFRLVFVVSYVEEVTSTAPILP